MTKLIGTDWLNDSMGLIVLRLVSHHGPDGAIDTIKRFVADNGGYEITVNVCGVELDFEGFVRSFTEHMDRMVTERAGELLKDRLGDLSANLFDTMHEIDKGLKAKAAEMLGYDPWENDR